MTHPLNTPSHTRVVSTCRPFQLNGRDQTRCVLLLHGYTGCTSDMRYPAERLHSHGLTVKVPRLPGHGTNGKDFHRTDWRDWLGAAVESYLDLASDFQEVMIGGLSMGGLLAAIIAGKFPVTRVALLAPAFFTVNKLVPFTPFLRFLVPPVRVNEPETYDDPEQQFLANQYWNWMWPAETASLYRLMKMGRRATGAICAPVLTVVSENDATVPLRVADYLHNAFTGDGNRTVVLKESGHVLTTGSEKETVADLLVEWFVTSKDESNL